MIGQLRPITEFLPKLIGRHMSTKTHKLKWKYGIDPKLNDRQIDPSEDLSFVSVRFAKLSETSSPLRSPEYERFKNNVLRDGKRDQMDELMDQTFYLIKTWQFKRKSKDPEVITDPMKIFMMALQNCEPVVITKRIKRGGAIYDVPFPLDAEQSRWHSMKWLIKSVLDRPRPRKKSFAETMAQELIEASENRGKIIKKRDDVHKLAEANKAYSHYRWG